MKRAVWIVVLLLIVAALVAWFEPTGAVRGWLSGQNFFESRPTRYWITALKSSEPAVAANAEQKLTAGGADAAAVLDEIFRTQAGSDPDAIESRLKAAELLGKVGPDAKPYSQTLLDALQDPDLHVRTVAAVALPKVNVPADVAVPEMIKVLDKDLNADVARALSSYGPDADAAIPTLVKILNDTKLDSELRWNAARTIGKMREKGAPAIDALSQNLKDEAPNVREHAAEAIGDIGTAAQSAAPALIGALTDTFWKARRDAARSLGQIGNSSNEVIEALEKLSADEDENVRTAAKTAIEALKEGPKGEEDRDEEEREENEEKEEADND